MAGLVRENLPSPQKLTVDEGLDRAYIEHLAATMPDGLAGMTIVVDGANGAAVHLAPALFERLGAKVDCIHCTPDGKNINLNCGALHVEALRKRVLETGATWESLSTATPTAPCSFRIPASSWMETACCCCADAGCRPRAG